jgi:aspartate/methionine/tyrosine aminotransferase
MHKDLELFAAPPHAQPVQIPEQLRSLLCDTPSAGPEPPFSPDVDERLIDLYSRVRNPDDPMELRDLFLGRVEAELGPHGHRFELADAWCRSTVRREISADEILHSRATTRFVKELFNWYFRDDLYGELRSGADIILSGGAVDEQEWGLPAALKDCIVYALDQDWYGYSDSRGRDAVREAVAAYESARIDGASYGPQNVALTLGGTFTVSALADFILDGGRRPGEPALCGIPNYPPLVESIARRTATRLVPLPCHNGQVSLQPLIDALTPTTPLVLLQTAANPTGACTPESELVRLTEAAAPTTMILLDECHEWLGPRRRLASQRAAPNVIRMSSLSKNWSAPGMKVGWMLADDAFIGSYYEYASTTFGGPTSFFYTAVEMLARMERWIVEGVETLGGGHLAEFEATYKLTLERLQNAYTGYREERLARERALTALRDAVVARCSLPGVTVVPPRYSINLVATLPTHVDSYLCFRDVLRETGVSAFPGILTFCLSGSIMRITTARRWVDVDTAMDRIAGYLAGTGVPGGHGVAPSLVVPISAGEAVR